MTNHFIVIADCTKGNSTTVVPAGTIVELRASRKDPDGWMALVCPPGSRAHGYVVRWDNLRRTDAYRKKR